MRGVVRRVALTLALFGAMAGPTHAVNPDERLTDPGLEARARAVTQGLRCVVCQNESVDDSEASIARDLRLLVRERLKAGDSDQQAVAFVRARYGDYVLLKPPVEPKTYVLWFAPVLLLAGAGGLLLLRVRHGSVRAKEPVPLDPEERRRLASLLSEGEP